MAEAVLFVDDEEYILNALERLFDEGDFSILRASNGQEALEVLAREEVAVLVSDNCMPGMTGVELLGRSRGVSPHTVKVLMTAYADLSMAIEAINQGEIFRFVEKPWNDEKLEGIIHESLVRYRLMRTVDRGDEATLLSLAQTIELKDPYTRGHCERVADYALLLAKGLGLGEASQRTIRYGSWLHDCGKIGIPEQILNYPGELDEASFAVIKKHPQWGADVAKQARLSPAIVDIILHHHERFDGGGYPYGLRGTDIPLETRIVTLADVFDAVTSDRPYRKGMSTEEAVTLLEASRGQAFDPELTALFIFSLQENKIGG